MIDVRGSERNVSFAVAKVAKAGRVARGGRCDVVTRQSAAV